MLRRMDAVITTSERSGSFLEAPFTVVPHGTDLDYFHPPQGADIAGQGVANPIAVIRSAAMLMEYVGHPEAGVRIEQAVIKTLRSGIGLTGDLGPSELPAAWAAAMRELLGVVPDNDREGCLEDIHWCDGNWD